MKKTRQAKRLLSMLLIFCMLFTYLPLSVSGNDSPIVTGSGYEKVVDASGMDGWKRFFGPDVMDTINAGYVWTDKSVFTDVSAFPAGTISQSDPNSFIVALSAIAANKEIVGYATIPTDTMLVLDLSGSMDGEASTLVSAANNAIKKLYDTNKNNRVGVVLYSGNEDYGASTYAQGATTLLPLDRYTTTTGTYLNLNNDSVSVNSGVRTSAGGRINASKAVEGSTYIQSGIYEAMLQFEKADTTIGTDNFQSGQSRLPILVLMSDGSPTTATHYYDEVNKKYEVTVSTGNNRPGRPSQGGQITTVTTDASTAGRGGGTSNSMGFLTQLTASYAMSRIEAHYGCAGEGLFYTLGLGVGNDSVAVSVLDPDNSTESIDKYWSDYFALETDESMVLSVPSTTSSNQTKSVSVSRNSYVTTQYYVDEYFKASNGEDLITAFQSLVDEIILQSRYYATDLEGGNPDFSGYIVFEDRIGEYMEVKNILGFFLGDVYYDGSLLASTLKNDADGGLGSVEDPSELGMEFIDSVKTRLGIAEQSDAIALVTKAFEHGQLSYSRDAQTGEVSFSNYIGWYAKADGSYAGFCEDGVTTAPEGAVYKVKSYGFLGKAHGNIKESDMMYMTVRVAESIATGMQTVHWKIPAALVPMVTYKVTLEGTSVENAQNVSLEREDAEPIRLVFETGLKSTINELNVFRITDKKHVAADGSRVFWTNYYDKSAAEHEDHIATQVFYTPSEENERYYYTTAATVYQKNGAGEYVAVSDSEALDSGNEYYHFRYVFTNESKEAELYWEPISAASLAKAEKKDGKWVIPIGTIYRYLARIREMKGENKTQSIDYYEYPFIKATNASLDVEINLGNNGQLKVYPATGIALTKMVDVVEPGTETTFKFRITLKGENAAAVSGDFRAVLANKGETAGEETTVSFTGGVCETELDVDKTLYIVGIPANTEYLVEEISDNEDYRVKTVHVNGVWQSGTDATGKVTQYVVDAVDFVNTPTTEGNLYITKQVTHPYGSEYTTTDKGLAFEITVELSYDEKPLANKTYALVGANGGSITTDAQGRITLTLAPGQTAAIHGLPEEAEYVVTEKDIANDGFTLDTQSSTGLSGKISSTVNAHAILVNEYEPEAVSPDNNEIVVEITKDLLGRDWMAGDAFEFTIENIHPDTGETADVVATIVINDENELTKLFDLTDEVYSEVGVYHYVITEKKASDTNGIRYDSLIRRFNVNVTDIDMDGYLEIAGVENVARTDVTETNGDYKVTSTFVNEYAAYEGTSVEIPVQKTMAEDNFALNGFKFALWDVDGEDMIVESPVTDVNGRTSLKLSFSASDIGEHRFVLAEVWGSINGMNYSSEEYEVVITVYDNYDGTVSARYEILDASGAAITGTPSFENDYDPTDAVFVFSGIKKLVGRILNSNEFEFNLYRTDASFATDGVTAVESVRNASDGSFLFSALTFDAEGEYYFVITETKGSLGGITYSEQRYEIKITVTDDSGSLIATSDFSGDIVFTNTYDPGDVTVELDGTKILSGRDIEDGEFEFVLLDQNGREAAVSENSGSTFTFGELTFDRAGEYVYTAEEVVGTLGGITYDRSRYTVKITVIDDGTGKLRASVSYEKDGVESTGIVFRNSYAVKPYDIELEGTKALTGRTMNEGEFSFTVSAASSNGNSLTVKNAQDGSFRFTGITVFRANDYHLRLVENNTGLGGVDYDSSIYDIYVTISDDGKGNLFESSRTVTKNGAAYDGEIVFENAYRADEAEMSFGGIKKLDGRDLSAGEFEFALYDAKLDEATSKIIKNDDSPETVRNAADGSFSFEPRHFAEKGTYYYVIEETEGDLGGVTYDKTVYTVKVTVTDNLDGTLSADTEYFTESGEAEGVVFNNSYKATSAAITVVGEKKLLGRELAAGEFDFELYEGELDANGRIIAVGAPLKSVKNALDGSFSFGELVFDAEGIRYYVVKESSDQAIAGVTYDTAEYYITVTVTDDGKGALLADVRTEHSADGEAEKIVFTNVYEMVPENPPTGDFGSFSLLFALLLSGGGAFAALLLKKKKEQ